MQDFLFWLGLIFTLFLMVVGFSKKADFPFWVAGVVFFILGGGLLGTGYTTYSVPNYTLTDTSATVTTVVANSTTFLAKSNGTPDQQILFGVGLFLVVCSLAAVTLAIQERNMKLQAAALRQMESEE